METVRDAPDTRPSPARRPAAPPPAVPVVNVSHTPGIPLGLRYSLLKLDSSGRYAEVSPDTVFRSGDKIRVGVDANDAAYLYIVLRGSSKTWRLLFPAPEIAGGDNRVERGRHYEIPSSGRFAFDEQPGEEKLFLILSRQPEEDLESLIYSLALERPSAAPAVEKPREEAPSPKILVAGGRSPIDDGVISRIRSQVLARDLIFEKVDDTTAGDKKEKAVYVVNPSRSPDARLVVDLSLMHR